MAAPPEGPTIEDPTIEQTATSIRVTAVLDADADDLFRVLADPRRHVDIDGSGTVRSVSTNQVITGVGQVFTMGMFYDTLGDYHTDNHILEFTPGRRIAWTTARAGLPPAGVRWSWALEPAGPGRTTVVHTYDWSAVTDPAVLARVSFPRVPAPKLVETVRRLQGVGAR